MFHIKTSFISCITTLIIIFFSFFSLFFPLFAFADEKPTLTVYSYQSFLSDWGPGKQVQQQFEQVCDCRLNIIGIGDAVTILNRLKLEGKHSKADVVIGLDNSLTYQAKQADLIVPHQLPKPANFVANVEWDHDFLPYDYGTFAFIYDKRKIIYPPHSMNALINNEQGWKIVYQDPRTSSPGLGLLFWMNAIYGDSTDDAWQALAKRTVTVTKGWSEAYSLFLKGEADFVLSYVTSPAVHIMNDNDFNYQAAIFDEGHYQQIEVAAITKTSKQFDLAQQFLAFLVTPAAQKQFVEKNIMNPVINIELPESYAYLPQAPKILNFTAEESAKQQKNWIKQWLKVISR